MEKSKKTGAQIYGYTVCLVSIITFLISISALVNAILNLGDPMHSGYTPAWSPSLASYESYKMDLLKTSQKGDEITKASYVPDDQTLRAMYEAAKDDKIQKVKHDSNGSIIVCSLLILIGALLFITHWRWMQKINNSDL
jgi:hypothetical protein